MKLDLKSIGKNSLKIVWENPILWLFGFFSSLFITNRITLIILNSKKITNWINGLITIQVLQNNFQIPSNFFQNLSSLPFSFFAVIFIILLLFFYISFLSQISVINLFSKISKKTKEKLNIKRIIKKNHRSIWRVALVYILSTLILGLILYIFKLSFRFALPIPILYYIVFFIILSFFIGLLVRIIVFSIILERNKIVFGTKKGWNIFWKNLFQIIKTCVFLFLISIVFGIGTILISITIAFPFLVLISFFLSRQWITGFQIIIFVWPIIQAIFLTILFAIFSAFQYGVWVEIYQKISS